MKKFNTWPQYSSEEIKKVGSILQSGKVNYWTGSECREFEKEFSEWSNSKYAIALSNGSVALELALRSLDLNKNDEVIVTPRSFIASASCVINVGAKPVFAEVDRDSGNITPESILEALTPKTRAVICVHLAGWPCDMAPIMSLAKKHNFFVIEDCAQAHGASYKDKSWFNRSHRRVVFLPG
jgi:dTDP-4-amino-4,6-dideoxygalactose transaminase